MNNTTKQGYVVYFLKAGSHKKAPIKIGYTKNLRSRWKSVQVGCPYRLELWGKIECDSLKQARKLERFLHRQLYHRFHMSGEWFRPFGDISKLLKKFNNSHKSLKFDTEVIFEKSKSYLDLEEEVEDLKREVEKLEADMEEYLDNQTDSYFL